MILKINNLAFAFLLSITFLSAINIAKAQSCDSGELGWNDMSDIFVSAGCAACHGVAGGFDLTSYASFVLGGRKCDTEIIQGNAFIGVITVDSYDGCGTRLSGKSMNSRVTVPLDSLQLLLIQRWVDAGIPEFCDDFCIQDEVVSTTLNNASYHFEVNNMLTATNEIINGSNITYEAGEIVQLNIGFSVDANSEFYAYIGACEL